MAILQSVLVALLVGALSASAFAKLAFWSDTVDWFADLTSRVQPREAALAVILSEVIVVAAITVYPYAGGVVATMWLTGASVVLFVTRRKLAGCACFGRRKSIGAGTAVRNGALIAGALGLVAASSEAPNQLRVESALAGAVIGIAVILLHETSRERVLS